MGLHNLQKKFTYKNVHYNLYDKMYVLYIGTSRSELSINVRNIYNKHTHTKINY